MLPGIAICVCQHVTSFEANSKKYLILFFYPNSIMAIRAARNSRRATRKYVTKVKNQISLAGQKAPKDQKGSSIKTSQDDIESAGKTEQYHQKMHSQNIIYEAIISEFYQQQPKMRFSTKLENTKMKSEQWQPKATMTSKKKNLHIIMCTTPSDNTQENLEH